MARRRSLWNRCFPQAHTSSVQQGISTLRARVMQAHEMRLEFPEFMSLIASPHEIEVLKEASRLIGNTRYYQRNTYSMNMGRDVVVAFGITPRPGENIGLFPEAGGLHPSAPPEIVESIQAWAHKRIEVGVMWAKVEAVFGWLNDNMENPAQLRFAWPSVVAALEHSNEGREFAAKLRDFKQPRRVPYIPKQVRDVMMDASATVATACLLPDPEPAKTVPGVRLRIESCGDVLFPEPFGALTPVVD